MIDDLHWIDNASVSLLFHLTRKLLSSRVMILGTYRPNEIHGFLADGSRHPMESVINELKRYFGEIELEIDFTSAEVKQSQSFIDAIIEMEPNNLSLPMPSSMQKTTRSPV